MPYALCPMLYALCPWPLAPYGADSRQLTADSLFPYLCCPSEQKQIPVIMVNKVILIGNLGRDPEVRYLEGNVAVARFSVATNESYKDKKGEWQTATEWHDVVAWRALAERAEKQLKKGSQVFVEGKLTHRKYQDKDGHDKYVTEVVANSFRVLDRKDSKPGGQDEDFRPEDSLHDTSSPSGSSGEQQADDDLPF